ncbi:MAG TPA: glycosyltransferase family A protein [Anaerolineae bacterium]|nr:glycosyltransferase family A protein [Anaerolineae bacterium]
MMQPKVSVIIPAYNQAEYLGAAIESILAQTYSNFELIIVNDASPDHTDAVVKSFNDPRIMYIIHPKNKHLAASRNTGMRASTGQIIMLLDADDLFHPEKLARHVDFLQQNPDIGVTYNSRIEIDAAGQFLSFWKPKLEVDLSDLVMSFPFSPSDMVLRREWAFEVDLFDESYTHFSEDLDINCRLALAGCKFAGIDRPLNYRRYHPNRLIKQASERCAAAIRAQEKAFAAPDCPAEVRALRPIALAKTYMLWSYEAFIVEQTAIGQEMLQQAAQLDSTIFAQNGYTFLEFLVFRSTQDGSEHEPFLRAVFNQLPAQLHWLKQYQVQTIANGYLKRGTQAAFQEQPENASYYFTKAKELGVKIDEAFLRLLADQLLMYEAEFGDKKAQMALQNLSDNLILINSNQTIVRWLHGCYAINQAFKYYDERNYSKVPSRIIHAISKDPHYLKNYGVLAAFVRSLVNSMRSPGHAINT